MREGAPTVEVLQVVARSLNVGDELARVDVKALHGRAEEPERLELLGRIS